MKYKCSCLALFIDEEQKYADKKCRSGQKENFKFKQNKLF
jgi:hypothetical protein